MAGAISEDDAKLLKFHGAYLQDDRDIRLFSDIPNHIQSFP